MGGDLLSVGIYSKQLAFFALLAAVAAGGVWYVGSQQSEASAPVRETIPTTSVASLNIALADGGKATINGKSIGGLVDFRTDRDVFEYQAYHEDGSFVDQLTTTVTLPRSVNPADVIARHTVTFGGVTTEPVVTTTGTTYVVSNLTPNASYRIELNLPKGIIEPSFLGQLVDSLTNLSPAVWVAVAIAAPLLALLILWGMFGAALRSWRGPAVREERDTPPEPISPALVAVLVHGKVSPRALAATLLHLAQRGFIQVVHRADGFSFGKRKALDVQAAVRAEVAPSPFELILLEKIFTADALRSTHADIQLRIGRHIFSRKVAEAYLGMYDAAVAKRWFVQNPQAVYRRYRSLSLIVVSAAIIGFMVSLLFGPEPYFYLLGWAGLFFVGLVMHQVTPFLPRRTRDGDAAYREWRKFQNYLQSSRPIRNVGQAQALYEQYLPYAVALGVEVEWTQRFMQTPFHAPAWYTTTEELYVIEDFANNLFPIIGSVASDLAKAREPHAI